MAAHLTVRFTASISDLDLEIAHTQETTIVQLKQVIRARIELPYRECRLRLIQAGRLLKDTDVLASVLKSPPGRPPTAQETEARVSGKGKGKAPTAETTAIFVNCSIGDALSPAELQGEALLARVEPRANLSAKSHDAFTSPPPTSTQSAPQGFDRLLLTGFTAPEVTQLRLQFLSIQSSIHTADSMPSPTTLRRMEDAWIDTHATGTTAGGSATTTATAFDFGDEGSGAGLDDFFWGAWMGFLWPLGALGWPMREEGIWSARRRMAVFTGAMLSVILGLLNVLG